MRLMQGSEKGHTSQAANRQLIREGLVGKQGCLNFDICEGTKYCKEKFSRQRKQHDQIHKTLEIDPVSG